MAQQMAKLKGYFKKGNNMATTDPKIATQEQWEDLVSKVKAKQDPIVAGDGITIDGTTVSADITPSDYFSADSTVSATGSTIILNNTAGLAISSLEARGDSSQDAVPSPDSQQPVHTVTGTQSIKVSGKNLSPALTAFPSYNSNGATSTWTIDGETGVMHSESWGNGIFWSRNNSNMAVCPELFKGGNTASFTVVANQSGNITVGFETSGYGRTYSVSTTPKRVSFPTSDANVFRIYQNFNSSNFNLTITDFQVELGDTATDYVPYKEAQNYTVNLGKNLFNKDAGADYLLASTITPIPTGVRATSPTGSSTATNYHYGIFSLLPVSNYVGKTLTLSVGNINASTAGNGEVAIVLCDADGSNASIVGDTALTESDSHSSYTVTSGNTGKYIGLVFYAVCGVVSPAGSYVEYSDVQLEVGSTATPYAEYFTPIELCKVAGAEDYIYKSGDDWYLHKATAKYTFNGTETLTESGSTNTYIQIRTPLQNYAGSWATKNAICDYFEYDIEAMYHSTGECMAGLAIGNNTIRFLFLKSRVATTTAVGQWLGSHTPTVYYEVNSPTDTKITDTTLVGQLNALADASTYDGQTVFIVSATSPNLPAILDVTTYRKSLAGTIDAINVAATTGSGGGSGDGTITEVQANGTTVATSGVANIPAATTSAYGVTQLTNSTSSTSTTTAATPSSVKSAYDLANGKATITMTNIDPGEGSALADGNYIAVYGQGGVFGDYSASEQDTGAKWLDGRKIYKKTVYTGAMPNASEKSVAHGISNLSRIIKIEGYTYNSGIGYTLPLPMASPTAANSMSVGANGVNIVISTGTDRSAYTESYVTLYYTKSS